MLGGVNFVTDSIVAEKMPFVNLDTVSGVWHHACEMQSCRRAGAKTLLTS